MSSRLEDAMIRIMAHTLGYRISNASWPLDPYRNRYAATAGSEQSRACAKLAESGLMSGPHHFDWSPYDNYYVTEHGKTELLETLSNMPLRERRAIVRGRR